MVTDGADEVVLADGFKVEICRPLVFEIDGVLAVASVVRGLCNFGYVMLSGREIESCKKKLIKAKERICQAEKFLNARVYIIQLPSELDLPRLSPTMKV